VTTVGTNPVSAGTLGTVIHRISGNQGGQVFIPSQLNGQMFFRRRSGSAWTAWYQVGVQDGPNVWSGSNTFASSVTFGAISYDYQPVFDTIAAPGIITAAQLLGRVIRYTGAAGNITTPTATQLDNATGGGATNLCFDVSIMNTSANTVTVVAGTGVTPTGNMAIASGESGLFRFRKNNQTPSFVVYRIA
jgi:hypothetical protein